MTAARRLAVGLLFAGALSACAGAERREATAAVRAYNGALVEAYRMSDPRRMEAVATQKECRKVWALIDLKRSAGLVLESSVQSMEVTSVALPGAGEEMEVQTRERWSYHDRSLKPGVPPGPEFVAEMRMRYHFVREGGGWKMDRGETLRCDYLQPEGPRGAGTPESPAVPGPAPEVGAP